MILDEKERQGYSRAKLLHVTCDRALVWRLSHLAFASALFPQIIMRAIKERKREHAIIDNHADMEDHA